MSGTPCIGLIVPPAAGQVPQDAGLLYGNRIRFIARGLGISAVSPDGFAPVIRAIVDRDVVRLAGLDPASAGFGRLFSAASAAA